MGSRVRALTLVVVAILASTFTTPGSAIAPGPGAAVPVVFSISTTKPIVFLTIDDGWYRVAKLPTFLHKVGVPTSLFLIADAARLNFDYFRSLQAQHAVIEDHTISHPQMPQLTFDQQKRQICRTAALFAEQFGRRPTLVRPPYGLFNRTTRRAAAACGMHALIYWDVTVNSGYLAYAVGDHLRPGDIILMHFTPKIRGDLAAALAAVHAAGLHPRLLENYL